MNTKAFEILMTGLRFCIGSILAWRAIEFISDASGLFALLMGKFEYSYFIFAHYVIAANLVGGIALALGLKTRMMAMINLPILFGAIAFVHTGDSAMSTSGAFTLASIVFVSLGLILGHGSGKYSVDHWVDQSDTFDELGASVIKMRPEKDNFQQAS